MAIVFQRFGTQPSTDEVDSRRRFGGIRSCSELLSFHSSIQSVAYSILFHITKSRNGVLDLLRRIYTRADDGVWERSRCVQQRVLPPHRTLGCVETICKFLRTSGNQPAEMIITS